MSVLSCYQPTILQVQSNHLNLVMSMSSSTHTMNNNQRSLLTDTFMYIIWLSPYNKDVVLSSWSGGTGPSQIIAVQAFVKNRISSQWSELVLTNISSNLCHFDAKNSCVQTLSKSWKLLMWWGLFLMAGWRRWESNWRLSQQHSFQQGGFSLCSIIKHGRRNDSTFPDLCSKGRVFLTNGLVVFKNLL